MEHTHIRQEVLPDETIMYIEISYAEYIPSDYVRSRFFTSVFVPATTTQVYGGQRGWVTKRPGWWKSP